MGSIAIAKEVQHYVESGQRAACQHCREAEDKGSSTFPKWYCTEGCFYVSALAVCNSFSWRIGQHG